MLIAINCRKFSTSLSFSYRISFFNATSLYDKFWERHTFWDKKEQAIESKVISQNNRILQLSSRSWPLVSPILIFGLWNKPSVPVPRRAVGSRLLSFHIWVRFRILFCKTLRCAAALGRRIRSPFDRNAQTMFNTKSVFKKLVCWDQSNYEHMRIL